MAPKKAPALSPIRAAVQDFLQTEPVLLDILNEEAAKLVTIRSEAMSELQKDRLISSKTRLRMNSSLQSILLAFTVRPSPLRRFLPFPDLFLFSGLG